MPENRTTNTEEMEFDLLPREVKVRVGNEQYVLREASAEAARQYNNWRMGVARFSATPGTDTLSVTGVSGGADGELLLVSLCLFSGAGPVPAHVLRGWPAHIVSKLFDRAKIISDLGDSAKAVKESAKNGQPPTPDTLPPPTGSVAPSGSTSAGPAC